MHFTLFPYTVGAASRTVSELKSFTIEVELPAAAAVQRPSKNGIARNFLFENRKFGAQWLSAGAQFSVAATDSWIDYSAEYVKLGVVRDAVYRLTYTDLLNYGVPVGSVDPAAVKIFVAGKELPIYVFGSQDGTLDEQDYVEFVGRRNYGDVRYRQVPPFGKSYYEFLNKYSDTTVYWLNWSGAPGKRIDTVVATSGTTQDTVNYYDHLGHAEFNNYWDFALNPNPGGVVRREEPELYENETWNDRVIGVGKTDIVIGVSRLVANKPAHAFVKMQNYASSVDQKAHLVALKINSGGATYDSGYMNKYEQKVLSASFSSNLLTQGTSTINIHSFATANTINSIITDWYELEYPRQLTTTSDSLTFSYRTSLQNNVHQVIITGLTGQPVTLYKFTLADSSYAKVGNYFRRNDSLLFVDSVKSGVSYFLIAESKTSRPLFFTKKKFSNLRSASRQAEYIAITHPYFLQSAANYVNFIGQTYGVSTTLVNVQDIYDEFNYGMFSPEPIRDFLKSSYSQWQQPKPKYVFLIGKATYDFYGYKTRNFGIPRLENFVPSYGNPVSDYWYTIWDSTGAMIPMLSIGRVPAKNIDEFNNYTLRHQKYVTKGFDDWNKQYIFFSGGSSTSSTEITQSKNANEVVLNSFIQPRPIGGNGVSFYKTINPTTNFGPYSLEFIKNTIEQGSVFISYIGHSGTQTWDNSIADVTQLSNIRDRNPLITDFGCSTAKHAEPNVFSFSELFVVDSKSQAISYIGNSSLGFTSTAYTFPTTFYKKLLVDTSLSIGESHRLAKIEYMKSFGATGSYRLFTLTNTIMGDPIVKLPIPQQPNLSLSKTIVEVFPDRPTDDDDSLAIRFSYNNFGKVLSDSVSVSVKSESQGTLIYQTTKRVPIPLYSDTMTIKIPVKRIGGEHLLTIELDKEHFIAELYETDNVLTKSIFVSSNSIKNVTISPTTHQSSGTLLFLNPGVKSDITNFNVLVSLAEDFSAPQTFSVPMDTFATAFTVPSGFLGKRIWMKTTFGPLLAEGLGYSFFIGSKDNILFHDDVAYRRFSFARTKVHENGIVLDTNTITFSAISAGANAGSTAIVSRNGQNLTPSSNLTGHHVGVFDTTNYSVVYFNRFNTSAGGANILNYEKLLDTLSGKYLLVIAVCNDGYLNLTTKLRNSLKSFGSRYIDSLTSTYSWAFIGRKGASPLMVKERFSRANGNIGRVQVDTLFKLPNGTGLFTTELIGPVAAWQTLETDFSVLSGSSITAGIIGVKKDQSADTLLQAVAVDSVRNISMINAAVYPYVKMFGTLNAGTNGVSPVINSLAVNYAMLPEVGTNYQAFKGYHLVNNVPGQEITLTDTIVQGAKVQFTYRIYNVGGTTAKHIPYTLTSIWDNNYVEQVAAQIIDSIAPESYKELTTQYSTSLGSGRRTIRLSIDPDTTMSELHKDNNIYTYPLMIKKSSGNPLLPNLAIHQHAVTSVPQQITDETDTARFTIVYSNTGSLANDSVSIQIKHFYQSSLSDVFLIRRKYPVSYDTIRLTIPMQGKAGAHQLSIDLDYTGLIVESSEADNLSNYYFDVATTEFKVLSPSQTSIAYIDKIVFLNPTVDASANAVVNLQVDTMPAYSTATNYSKQIQQFATTFPLPGLLHSQRYYWRVKIADSPRDWTTGSFYSGDSARSAIGQFDSVAWNNNIFTHSSYSADSGARIVDSKFIIKAFSAGFSDGNSGAAEVNGINILTPILGSGHNVVVVDSVSFSVVAARRFDLASDAAESDSLTQFIGAVAAGTTVIDVVVDDGSNNLLPSTRNALQSIGSKYIDLVSFRDSWAIIGRKGAAVGTVPEVYKVQNSGSASTETTIVRQERSGTIETPLIGPFTTVSELHLNGTIPSGSQVKVQFVGVSSANNHDTLVTATNQSIISLGAINTRRYRNGKLVFTLTSSNSFRTHRSLSAINSPVINSWKITAVTSTELAVSGQSSGIDRNQVMEGEVIQFSGKLYNVSTVKAESVLVQLKTNASGIDNILKQQRIPQISAGDSAAFTFAYDTRGKRGNHALTFEIDPLDSVAEQTKANNSVSIPYVVLADTMRPIVQVTFDGVYVLNGDYVGRQPEIRIRLTDNNPAVVLPSDTSNFTISLNNTTVPFTSGTAELLNSNSPGRTDVRWTPTLTGGENVIKIMAKDVSGNYSDTILLFVNVAMEFRLLDIFNLPNPFTSGTQFTFNLAGPAAPDEVNIKIYTIAGRLIQDIETPGAIVGFNKIQWDGRDKDGDEIGNGVYLYKVIVKQGSKQTEGLSKLVKMR
ncbi:MAG: C25 family cysteine peptidase [Bacteriovoracaceae bacterium]